MLLNPYARVGIAVVLLGSAFKAVEPGLPSKTAVYIAAARAIGSKNPDPQLRNPDYLAIKFLGPRERAVLPDYPMDALDLDFAAAMERIGHSKNIAVQVFRTKAFDAALVDATPCSTPWPRRDTRSDRRRCFCGKVSFRTCRRRR